MGFGKMTFPVQFRFADDQLRRLDARAQAEGVSRAALLRALVSEALEEKPDINVERLSQTSEYSTAALAVIVANLMPDKQSEIVALTAERLEQFHGQK